MARRRSPFERKQVDRESKSPHILIAKGEVNVADKALITQLLGRFGLSSSFMGEEEYIERERRRTTVVVEANPESTAKPNFQRFSDITSPKAYMVREHFDDFRSSLRPDISKLLLTNAFHVFLNHERRRLWGWNRVENRGYGVVGYEKYYTDPTPMPGIKIANREEVGFDEYVPLGSTTNNYMTRYLAKFAIEAGSIIDATQGLAGKTTITKTEELQLAIANQLHYQFED